jgi:small subunit ribosomal protein S17
MKQLQGTIIRVNDQRTAKVQVERQWMHPKYKKYVKRTKNYLVEIPSGLEVAVGDPVNLQACAPVSRTKFFVITEKRVIA